MTSFLSVIGAAAGLSLGAWWLNVSVDLKIDPPAVVCEGGWVTACVRVPGGLSLTVQNAPDLTFSFEGLSAVTPLGYSVRAEGVPEALGMGEGTCVPLARWPQAATVTFYALSGEFDWADVVSVSANPTEGVARVASSASLYSVAAEADADGDGLPDAWETHYGLDLNSAEGMSGAEGDPDGDGLSNLQEYRLGTDPTDADTDDDGLNDGREVGTVLRGSEQPPIDVSNGTLLFSQMAGAESGVRVTLPFPVVIAGRRWTKLSVGAKGVVTFLDDSNVPFTEPGGFNVDLAVAPLDGRFPAVALYWDDLWMNAGYQSRMDVTEMTVGEARLCVVELLNFGLPGESSLTLARLQLMIPENPGLDGLEVRYATLQGAMDAASASIGAQHVGGRFPAALNVAFNQAGSVVAGDSVTYRFGVGSDPLNPDTDGDGATDGEEVLAGTSPVTDDDDMDGLPDGWELRYGLDPKSAEGDNGAEGDPDGDGLSNTEEFLLGTDPTKNDSDGDGLSDAAEVGRVIRRSGVAPFDVSGGTPVFLYDKGETSGYKFSALPFPVRLDGLLCTRVGVNVDGVITFVTDGIDTLNPRTLSTNQDLRNAPLDARFPSVALYWDDLSLVKDFRSQIVITDVTRDGRRFAVIELLNFAKPKLFGVSKEPSSTLLRLQLIVPENPLRDGLEVRYATVQGQFDGSSATFGAQHVGGASPGQLFVAYNETGKIAAGDSITYYFGTGTNPAQSDTDGDGLNDGDEFTAGTNPNNPDTDGDGLPDGWEVLVGYDPHVPTDKNLDSDNDGLTDYEESQWGTHPEMADSDGDGVADNIEIGQSSDPTDATDGGVPNSRIKASFVFGDHSASASEMYAVTLFQIAGPGVEEAMPKVLENLVSNACETREALLRPDAAYRVTMRHISSTQETPDMDYTLTVPVPEGSLILVVDKQGLQGAHDVDTGEAFPGAGKELFIYCLEVSLLPDYDRDGVISEHDRALAKQGTPLRMWENGDRDIDIDNGVNNGRDCAYSTPEDVGYRDCDDFQVDGKCDIEDFFPIKITFGEALSRFLLDNSDHYLACVSDSTVGCVWCYGDDNLLETFYSPTGQNAEKCFGPDGTESRWTATVEDVSSTWLGYGGLWLPGKMLGQIRNNGRREGLMFIEGTHSSPTTLKVLLRKERGWAIPDDVIAEPANVSLHVAHVRDMYDTLNIRNSGVPAFREATAKPLSDATKTVFFLHGYSVTEETSEEWFSTVFKRLWQSGMNADFCGVTWKGDDEGNIPDYYKNVKNAFVAAGRLNGALQDNPTWFKPTRVMMAHSLGNMVVSSMLQDYSTPMNDYFMLNAAVPAEAYETLPPAYDFSTNSIPAGLVHDAWKFYPAKSRSNFWYRHFLPHDDYTPTEADVARSTLTWRGRFKDVLTNRNVNVYNYFATGDGTESGDEVFELMDVTPNPSTGFEWFQNKGRYSWQKQECYKGRHTSFWDFKFAASDTMGWGFNPGTECSPATAEAMTDEALRTAPLFYRNPSDILSSDAEAILALKPHLLAYAIPAMTVAAGRVNLINAGANIDCQDAYVDTLTTLWARGNMDPSKPLNGRWLHSDIKTVAYPFTRVLFKNIIHQGNLQ